MNTKLIYYEENFQVKRHFCDSFAEQEFNTQQAVTTPSFRTG